MAIRISPGPVFVFESLIFARRWQVYAGRAVFVLALLIGLCGAWVSAVSDPVLGAPAGTRPGALQALARVGQAFFSALAGVQLAMVLLVAPAATAGAICHDRARGILAQMATTELSDAEIVLGKLFSRLVPILGLLACALPVTALAALLGGVDIQALFSLFAVSAAVVVLGCALALLISVRVARAHEAIMAVLALWAFWLLSSPLWSGLTQFNRLAAQPEWFQKANPFMLVYAPYSWPGYVGPVDVAVFVAGALAISAGLVALAIAGLRGAVLPVEPARRGRIGRAPVRHLPDSRGWLARLPGPSLDDDPVLWREWRRARPSRMARILWAIYWLAAIAGMGTGIALAFAYGINTPAGGFLLIMSFVLQSGLGLLLLSGQAPTSLGEDRVQGSLDVLMTTPLSTRAIVRGKWLGTYRIVAWLAILPGLVVAIVACALPSMLSPGRGPGAMPVGVGERIAAPAVVVGLVLSYGATVTSLGLLLATWIRRPGRAIAVSVAVFVLIAVGWPYVVEAFLWGPLQSWMMTTYNLTPVDLNWLSRGLAALSPLLGPALTMDGIGEHGMGPQWKFHLVALGWCLLDWAFAAAFFWAALRSFDRCLGRMRETSQPRRRGEAARSGATRPEPLVAAASPRLAADADGCQNGDR